MNKQLLKLYFFLSHFGLFLPIIKIFVALLSIKEITTIIINGSEKNIYLNRFARNLILVYIYFLLYSVFCFLLILYLFSYNNVLIRFLTQQVSLFLLFFQIYLGFLLAMKINPNKINNYFQSIVYILFGFGFYQIFSFKYGLPYIGHYAYDLKFGLRVSSLCGEPKFFSSILVISLFYFKDLIIITKTKIFIKILFLILLLYLLIKAGSGNGYLSFIILLILNIYLWRPKLLLFGVAFITLIVFLFLNNYEILNLRPSHVVIIESIKVGQISFNGWDDLIVLPLLSWIKYPYFLISGYGFNLNHFFALEFINSATWLDGNTYINGNFSIIDYISSFGIILPVFLFIFLTKKTRKLLNSGISSDMKLVTRFAYYTFVVGIFMGANISILFFGSIGILFYLTSTNITEENIKLNTEVPLIKQNSC